MLVAAVLTAPLGQCITDPDTPFTTIGRPAVAAMAAAQAQVNQVEREFLAVPTAGGARASLQHITSRPHVAGTPGDHAMAVYVRDEIRKAGIADAEIEPQTVLLTYPLNRSLDLVDGDGKVVLRAPLSEAILPSDPTSDTWWRNHTFNAYSPSGDVTSEVVYANYGFPEDFEALKAAGIDPRGKVALMRYGKCFRGLKAMNAERNGALAALIYSDPEEDGYAKGSVYPDGPWRPPSSVQRGSIQFISLCPGDPSRAYLPEGELEALCGYNQSELIPNIPTLPLSYEDAAPLLKSLGGPNAPPNFRGALNLTYRLGPSTGVRARLSIRNSFEKRPVWNVLAKVGGTLPPDADQPIFLGNHRDAWVYGAADPNSGTAQLIEVAKGLGALLRTGWRPRRSLVLCSWSGEEYGLLGSTAYSEVHAKTPMVSRALAYLNVDTGVSGANFRAQGTPSFGRVLAGALGAISDPARPGHTIADSWNGDLSVLGSGSDYTAYLDHLGIPSLDLAFSPKDAPYGVYHSVFDSFEWMDTVGDPGFQYHVAMAQLWGLIAIRLAGTAGEAPAPLPLNFTLQAEAIGAYIADAKARPNGTKLDYTALDAAHAKFAAAARKVLQAEGAAVEANDVAAVEALNEQLAYTERQFLLDDGLPGRKYFKHVLQAPGLYTGYAPKTLPGVYDAVSALDWPRARAQAALAAAHIEKAAAFLENGLSNDRAR